MSVITHYLLLAHPDFVQSRVNRRLLEALGSPAHVLRTELYERYPQFLIDVEREQTQVMAAATIVMQFPMYWYAAPALLAQWCEEVLTPGFAHGKDATSLHGKTLQLVVSTGRTFHPGEDQASVRSQMCNLLEPLALTAGYCGMTFAPPLIHLASDDLAQHCERYAALFAARSS
jgi:putative NADPH-quinone reductase